MLKFLPIPGPTNTSDLLDLADLVIANAADSIFVLDTEGRTIFANSAAERTFGWTCEELHGKRLHDLIHHHYPDGRPFPMSECPLGQVFLSRTRLEKHEDVFFHRDSTRVNVACSNAPIVRNGDMVAAVLIAVDITERKRTEEHQRLLLNELNHRVKNTLATVQSLVSHSLRSTTSSAEARTGIESRLRALARAHDVLTRERWESARLSDVVAHAIEPFDTGGHNRFHCRGPDVRLGPAKVLAIAMALQELATNALKYGSLSNREGRVWLTWCVEELPNARVHIAWEERGGPPVSPPSIRGFGTRLIERSLAQDLNGEGSIAFLPGGVVCKLSASLA